MKTKYFKLLHKKAFTTSVFALLIVSLFFLSSCSSNLSRNKAEKMLLENKEASWHTLTINANYHKNFDAYNFVYNFNWEQFVPKLVENGYLSFNRQYYNVTYYSLSSKFIKYIKDDKGSTKTFLIAELKDIEITGITGDDTYKSVNYTVTYTANEIGVFVLNSTETTKDRTADFRKYDDGWRLEGN
jgi:hypothetical protein